MIKANDTIAWLSDVEEADEPHVGRKNATLAALYQTNFPVPNGFILTDYAFRAFIEKNDLQKKIKHLLGTLNYENTNSLSQVTLLVKRLIMTSQIPEEVSSSLFQAYERLGSNLFVVVRSSFLAPSRNHVLFAGHEHSFIGIRGEATLADKIREAWASVYNPEAVLYRHKQKLDHMHVGISLFVQQMLEQEVSGTIYTIDPVKEDKTKIIVEAAWGLNTYLKTGKVVPDYYEVDKKALEISYKRVCEQDTMLIRREDETEEEKVPQSLRETQKIRDKEIIQLAELAREVERYVYFPQEIEWAKNESGICILDMRPFTTVKKGEDALNKSVQKNETQTEINHPILVGEAVSPGIGVGHVRIVKSNKDLPKVHSGDILVVPFTTPDYIQAMKISAGIVTEQGERISHAALVSQELGIPAIVGTVTATKILKDGDVVTVNGKTGEVFKGSVYSLKKLGIEKLKTPSIRTTTRLYTNLAEPELAEEVAAKNVDGVGLLRSEYLIAQMGVHPKKFIHERRSSEFVKKLAEGIEHICRAFYPRPVVYRTTDFKTNEYRELDGGRDYEPIEQNPMLGFRGASRYIRDPHVFNLQMEAFKLVREKKGLHNLHLMLPFVRTPQELLGVKKLLSAKGIRRSQSLKLFMMVEIPSNVVLIDKFIECGLDGVSIGSNDLTMLFLGVDRDNSEVSHEFNECNEALLWAYEKVISACKKHGVVSSICGQAPSYYPELVEKLVDWGINGISVSPDSIDTTRMAIYNAEKKLQK